MPFSTSAKEILIAAFFGVVGLLFFHLDHLVVTYNGWNDPAWLLHLVVDGSYIVIYGFVAWVVMRGWRRWRESNGRHSDER
ncbi:MAG: hypothetical protein KDD73_03610 [Anaerolineales bacterium]|nr:hypothetical protein [Anaerolineales bacterium]MCB9172470.1 hypothetical protein [Ardenticatenales bacterium]